MIKKHLVLIGVLLSFTSMLIAISIYPGGSMFDPHSVGFQWSKNFISNLFLDKALNGSDNHSRVWAYLGMFLLGFSYAVFFINMGNKLPDKKAGYILKYAGTANFLFMFLIVTRLHDIMLYISISLFGTCLFVITVFIMKSKLYLFKFFCATCLIAFYYGLFLWGFSNWNLLPIIQKVNFIGTTLLFLGLEYFTSKEDFEHIRPRGHREQLG